MVKLLTFFWLFCYILVSVSQARGLDHADKQRAEAVLKKFYELQAAAGTFWQIGPRGEKAQGKFSLLRPGKMRFSYQGQPLEIISDGHSIAVHNRQLESWSLYRLDQTPLKFVLNQNINIKDLPIRNLETKGQQLTITLRDKNSRMGLLKLIFNRKTEQLEGWVAIDAQNLTTKVYLKTIQTNVVFSPDMFTIPYQDIAMQKGQRNP